jgi:segregation and condensation protein A
MAYRVKLDFFEGPLDLLLHLVRKNEVDILDIPIAIITHQYLEYIRWMKELNLDVAGDFLLMAATLIQIKARMLIPSNQDQVTEDEEEGGDPRQALIRRLAEYQRFREATYVLEKHHQLERDVFLRGNIAQDVTAGDSEYKMVSVFALVDAFRQLLENLDKEDALTVDTTELSIRDKMGELMKKLHQHRELRFEALFSSSPTRLEIVTCFLALLELMRLRLIKVYQALSLGVIRIILAVENGKSSKSIQ